MPCMIGGAAHAQPPANERVDSLVGGEQVVMETLNKRLIVVIWSFSPC